MIMKLIEFFKNLFGFNKKQEPEQVWYPEEEPKVEVKPVVKKKKRGRPRKKQQIKKEAV